MMGWNLQNVWIITNYPLFRAALQMPLSRGILNLDSLIEAYSESKLAAKTPVSIFVEQE